MNAPGPGGGSLPATPPTSNDSSGGGPVLPALGGVTEEPVNATVEWLSSSTAPRQPPRAVPHLTATRQQRIRSSSSAHSRAPTSPPLPSIIAAPGSCHPLPPLTYRSLLRYSVQLSCRRSSFPLLLYGGRCSVLNNDITTVKSIFLFDLKK